jgi:hypothetical protein
MKKRSRQSRYSLFVAWLVLLVPGTARSLGLAMKFVDITLENVAPGASFNLRVIRNLPLVVINLDAVNEHDIVVESVLPKVEEMKENYEPIPDPSWIKIVPTRFRLGPKASASADVIVTIPDDPKLIGKHFEAILWAHTDPRRQMAKGTGVLIQAGLRSRFRMSIGTMGPASLQREKKMKRLAEINTNFSISPDNLFVQNVALGKPVDLKLEKKAALRVINEADEPVKLRFDPIIPDENILPQSGYVYAPEPKWLTIRPDVITTPGTAIKEVRLTVNIPDKPEYRGQKYMFLVRTTLADESLPLAYNNMIYVTTEP